MPHGGKRQGAGRKKKFPSLKTPRSIWLPEDVADFLDDSPKVVEAMTDYEFRRYLEELTDGRKENYL